MTFTPPTHFPKAYVTSDGRQAMIEGQWPSGFHGWIWSRQKGRARRIKATWNPDGTHRYYTDGRAHPNNLADIGG